MIETTNINMNTTLWELLTPLVLSWVRANVATLHLRLRRSGPGYLRRTGHLQQSMDGAEHELFTRAIAVGWYIHDFGVLPGSHCRDKSEHLNEKRYWPHNIPAILRLGASGFGSPSAGPAWGC